MTLPSTRNLALAIVTLLVGAACTSGPPGDEVREEVPLTETNPESTEAATLATATKLGVLNARMPLPDLVTAGQPTEEQFAGLTEAGFRHFISLRAPDEAGAGWEEEQAVGRPFHFERLPISGAAALTRENVEALAALIESMGDEPTLLYCGSSNRVGAMLALKAYWVDGAEAEAALELGRQAGMTRLTGAVRGLLGLDG